MVFIVSSVIDKSILLVNSVSTMAGASHALRVVRASLRARLPQLSQAVFFQFILLPHSGRTLRESAEQVPLLQ